MANRFRLVPVEAKVTACDRQIRRHGHFLALSWSQQSAIVAYAQAKATLCGPGCPLPNHGKQGEFACRTKGARMGRFYPHFMRIWQRGAGLAGRGSCYVTFAPIMSQDGHFSLREIH
jgi:hypothetical protein